MSQLSNHTIDSRVNQFDGELTPLHTHAASSWESRNLRFLRFLAGILLVLGLFAAAFDASLSVWVSEIAADGTVLRRILKLSADVFDWWSFVLLGIVLLVPAHRVRLLVGYAAVLGSFAGLTHFLKIVVGRARPELDLGVSYFAPFTGLQIGFDSFPSGHAATAVVLTLLAGSYFPRTRWLLMPLAILASLSRVAQRRHFVTDIFCGSLLSIGIVWMWLRLLGERYFRYDCPEGCAPVTDAGVRRTVPEPQL